jgi:anaerobic ribonucleoside-triphosphate reductase activating protein
MSRHWGSEDDSVLRLARLVEQTEVLGPGRRTVVVVQGCHLRCGGCIAEATHPLDGGHEVEIPALADRLSEIAGVSGITFTGGEPFLQSAAIAALIDGLRSRRPDFSAMSYSGYRLDWLLAKGSPTQLALLDRLDLLIDGPYVQRLHAPLLWRGSRNQRLHSLSPRHVPELEGRTDASAGLEMSRDSDLGLEWVGVPPYSDFSAQVEALRAPQAEPVPTDRKEQR